VGHDTRQQAETGSTERGKYTVYGLSERRRRRAYCMLVTMAMSREHCLTSQCNAALPVLYTCTGFNSPHRAVCQVSWGGAACCELR